MRAYPVDVVESEREPLELEHVELELGERLLKRFDYRLEREKLVLP